MGWWGDQNCSFLVHQSHEGICLSNQESKDQKRSDESSWLAKLLPKGKKKVKLRHVNNEKEKDAIMWLQVQTKPVNAICDGEDVDVLMNGFNSV